MKRLVLMIVGIIFLGVILLTGTLFAQKKKPNQLTRALLMLEQCGGWGAAGEIAAQADVAGVKRMRTGNVRKILRTEGIDLGVVQERIRPGTKKVKEYRLTAAGRRHLKEEP